MQENINNNLFANAASHSGSVNLFASNEPMFSQELKKLRLKISDYNKSQIVDAVCQKVSYFFNPFRYGVSWFKCSTTRTYFN